MFGSLLFDLEADPGQEHPLVDDELERRMASLMAELMRANDAPPEQFQRLGLPSTGVIDDEHLLVRRQQTLAAQTAEPLPAVDDLPDAMRSPVRDLLADPATAQLLEEQIPGLLDNPRLGDLGRISLIEVAALAPSVLNGPKLRALADVLAR